MIRVAIDQAGARLAQLVRDASPGEEIILTENEQAVAKLIPLQPVGRSSPREGGTARGQILYMAEDFDAPLDAFADCSRP